MGICWTGAVWPVRGWARVAGLVALTAVGAPGLGWCATADSPSAHELALLAYANMSRADNNLRPLVWNDGLGRSAQAHSDDVIAHGCTGHDSCNGETWWRRIQRYYPGWFQLGEVIGDGGSDPRAMHDGWMSHGPHRAQILGPFAEFGAGIAIGDAASGYHGYGTEDFGDRGAVPLDSIPTLPAGGASPRRAYSDYPRELVVNYYHRGGGAPRSVRALVGSRCIDLPRISGSASNGTYGITRLFTDGCYPVVFEAVRSDGLRYRWPEQGAIQLSVGPGVCDEFTASAPTQDCGGGTLPAPTPTPTPTPPGGGSAQLDAVRVVLKADTRSDDQVRIEATLPALASFDPRSGPIAIHVGFGTSGDWSQDLPQMCGKQPCLKTNRRETVYNGSYAADTKLSFTRGEGGRWKMRLFSRRQILQGVAPGPVALSVTVDGTTFTGSADGRIRNSGLVAD